LDQQSADSPGASKHLLARGERPPFRVRNAGARARLLFVADHAGVAIPARLAGLGLPRARLASHIAVDVGVGAVGRRLATSLGATLIEQRFSRLVIDCNRDPARPDSICETSDGVAIPGNLALGPEARGRRIDEVFGPYHRRIERELDARAAAGTPTLFVSLHSFTPMLQGFARPWRLGVLHMNDSPFSAAVLRRLRSALSPEEVGDNQPYRMDGTDFTVPRHALARGLDYLELEIRQDLIDAAAGALSMARLLSDVLPAAAADMG